MADQDPNRAYHPIAEDGTILKRYERPHESIDPQQVAETTSVIPFDTLKDALGASSLTPGAKSMLAGLLRLGQTAMFPGGGAGIEYGSLLKTAARPDYIAEHVREAAGYLHEKQVNLLVVPGMSGYPVGSMYSVMSGVPALLLKKQKHVPEADSARYPAGSFVIPSYTGDGDVVMSADLSATQDIVDSIVGPQLEAQASEESVTLSVRVAGADDIIDKATMSQAVSESAIIVGAAAVERFVARYRARSGDDRQIVADVRVVAWVTPLIKGYNRPQENLNRWFGITPFAGLNVTSVHLDPPALGIEGLGIVEFYRPVGA